MKARKSFGLIAFFIAIALVFTGCAPSGATQSDASQSGDTAAYAQQMDADSVLRVEISVDADEWRKMLDSGSDEDYVAADITINGTTVQNVGIRPKGNSSRTSISKDDSTDRYSFKIKFDEYVDDQSWLGLDKLNLNNNFSDASSMKEYLSYDIMRYIGVDTPLYCYADISVNGESWGFYLAIEDYDTSYKARAKDDAGALYKPDSMEMDGNGGMPDKMGQMGMRPDMAAQSTDDTQQQTLSAASSGDSMPQPPQDGQGAPPEEMQNAQNGGAFGGGQRPDGGGWGGGMKGADDGVALIYTDDDRDSYSSIFDNAKTKTDETDEAQVIEAIRNLNAGTDLETYVDVDATLRYLAAHTFVVNLDSYSGSFGHNYILYENDGRLSMLPWDYNMAFGGFQSSSASSIVNFAIDTPVSGVSMEDRPMISKLLEVPEYLEQYHQYLQQIIDGYFANGAFEAKVDTIDAMISSYIQNDPTAFYTYAEYQKAVPALKTLGALRAESVSGQLDGSIPATNEGQSASPDKLIDASAVSLSDLGSAGGGQGGPGGQGGGNFGNPGGRTPNRTANDTERASQSAAG